MTTYVEEAAPHIRDPFAGYMIDRATFDAALVTDAVAAGAVCRFGTALRTIDRDGAVLLSSGEIVTARVVIGGDGPRSAVGCAIGQRNRELAETRQITVQLLRPHEATDIFLSAGIRGGYGWMFPKGGVANLGLGVEPAVRHLLKPLLDDLHGRLVRDGMVGTQVLRHTGGAIPVGGMLRPAGVLGATTVLLAGDAAGLTNPVTGAGIASAVMSGGMAGEAAIGIRRGNEGAAESYANDLDDLFGAAIGRALMRRCELMRRYERGEPTAADLQRSWIAFTAYWQCGPTEARS